MPEGTDAMSFISIEDATDAHITGIMSFELASVAACYTYVRMNLPEQMHGKELNYNAIDKYAEGVMHVVVSEIMETDKTDGEDR